MKYQARNNYNEKDTCGHLHRSEKTAQKCCERIFSHNVGAIVVIFDDWEAEAQKEGLDRWEDAHR